MLDIKYIVAHPDEVKKRLSLRKPELAAQIDGVLTKYSAYKTVLARVEELRAKRNEMSKSIGKIKKEQGDEAAKEAMAEVGKLKEEMAVKEAELDPLKKEINDLLLSIPNLPNEKIPVGVSDADNPEYLPCTIPLPKFDFKPLDHQAVGEKLGILDFEAAAALSGSRFALFKGDGARLERAIIAFMLDMHAKKGYTEILPPVVVNEDILIGTGQLPKFLEDMYELVGEPKQFLISTAEIPLTNLNRIRVIPAFGRGGLFEPGDTIQILTFEGKVPPDAKVLAVEVASDPTDEERRRILATNLREPLVNAVKKALVLTLDRAVDFSFGTVVIANERMGNGFTIRNCTFGSTRARAMLIKASNGLIENNTVERSYYDAISIYPEYYWLEGGCARNVTIRGNTLRNNGGGIYIGGTSGNGTRLPPDAHSGMVLENNTIIDSPQKRK